MDLKDVKRDEMLKEEGLPEGASVPFSRSLGGFVSPGFSCLSRRVPNGFLCEGRE